MFSETKSISSFLAIALAVASLALVANVHGAATSAVVGAVAQRSHGAAALGSKASANPLPTTDVAAAAAIAPSVVNVVSRKAHGAAGTFSLPLAATPLDPTTEPRTGPAHTVVFVFDKPVIAGSATVSEGTASVGSASFAGNEMIVPLTGVANQQYVTVNVSNVTASDGGVGTGSIRVGFLTGDVNQNRSVSLADLVELNRFLAQTVVTANFRADVNVSGTLSVADVLLANAQLTLALPSPMIAAPISRRDAARFMRQATFGASRTAIDALVAQGYTAWLDAQFAKPSTSHLATVKADPFLVTDPWWVTMPSVWKQFFEGDDQLRQRMAFALSQIFVVSLNNTTVQDAQCGPAAYLDILNRGAFGNVRDLLKDITLNPVMGEYLSMKYSAKADPVLQTQPDENYAREVMQLFSIGTVMLNIDGTVKRDALGKPIPTYTEDTVKAFAKALSGWTYAGQNQTNPWTWLWPDLWDDDPKIRLQKACPAWSTPMQPWTRDFGSADGKRIITGPAHDTSSKQLLVYAGAPYSTLPANQSPQTDLENLIDNVFNHPNVGPFLAKQLIMRLVTSNPSPEYVARVATKFNNNGSGVRGDMKAVIRAILLDDDARSLTVAASPSFGKLTEPVVRFVQLHRAFNAKRASGYYDIWDTGSPEWLNQSPMHSPSVFNFYRPDYAPAGPVSQSGLVAPEFEITNASSVAGFAEFSKSGIINGYDYYNGDPSKNIKPDYSYYLGLTTTPTQLIDELDMVLCAGGMNAAVKAQIADAVGKVTWWIPAPGGGLQRDLSREALERLDMALWLIINSPDYSVQK